MEQAGQCIFDFLTQYGYWVMLPLAIVEGPATTLVASILASLGALNIFLVFAISIVGDIIGDVFLYFLGYRYGIKFSRVFGKYIGITQDTVGRMEKYFDRHGGKPLWP
jgi:membrane-associated protein